MTSNPVHGMEIGADWAFIGFVPWRFDSSLDDEVYEMALQRVTGVLKDVGLLRLIGFSYDSSEDECGTPPGAGYCLDDDHLWYMD